MAHLKRHRSPAFWPIKRKGVIWTAKPRPGPHPLIKSIPLIILVRDILKLGSTASEARAIIKQGKITVDKKVRKDPNFPLGLMDVVEIDEIKKQMRVVIGDKGLEMKDIDPSESTKKTCMIQGKATVRGGVSQLALHDGRNILAENNEYRPGDGLLISVPDQQILEHFKFEEGAPVTVTGGKNVGVTGTLEKIFKRETILQKNKVIVDTGKGKIETLKKFVLVSGKADGKSTNTVVNEENNKPKKKVRH